MPHTDRVGQGGHCDALSTSRVGSGADRVDSDTDRVGPGVGDAAAEERPRRAAAADGGRVVRVGPGLHRWGRASSCYPNWSLDYSRYGGRLEVEGVGMGCWRDQEGDREGADSDDGLIGAEPAAADADADDTDESEAASTMWWDELLDGYRSNATGGGNESAASGPPATGPPLAPPPPLEPAWSTVELGGNTLAAARRGLTVLSGQWRLSNGTYGRFRRARLVYDTVLRQPVLFLMSGPWVLEDCAVRCANGFCVRASTRAQLLCVRAAMGGTGPGFAMSPQEKRSEAMGVILAERDADVELRDSRLEYAEAGGLHLSGSAQGRLTNTTVRECGFGVFMAHFSGVVLHGCRLVRNPSGALVSMTYRAMPERCPDSDRDSESDSESAHADEFEYLPNGTAVPKWVYDHRTGRRPASPAPEPAPGLAVGRLRVRNCTITRPYWCDTNRPFELDVDDEALR